MARIFIVRALKNSLDMVIYGFTANYLMMDGIREPISLSDLKSNINRINSIF